MLIIQWIETELPCFVYFIRNPKGNIKIGVSRDVDARLRNLSESTCSDQRQTLTLEGSVEFKNRSEAVAFERQLHREFCLYRIKGEWFMPSKELQQRIQGLTAVSA